jgi:predicted metal-dependent peptidase
MPILSERCPKLPAGMAELVKESRKDVADWKAILRELIEQTVPSDYSWLTPNRRHIADGLYLPGMTKENLGHVAIAVDTSGSIDTELLSQSGVRILDAGDFKQWLEEAAEKAGQVNTLEEFFSKL